MPLQRLTITEFGFAYGVALVTMAVLDGIWLGWLARDLYRREIAT